MPLWCTLAIYADDGYDFCVQASQSARRHRLPDKRYFPGLFSYVFNILLRKEEILW